MKIKIALVVSLLAAITLVITACTAVPEDSQMEDINSVDSVNGDLETATFAGGCFWCMEPPFEMLDGVEDVISGYTGGDMENPSYEEVVSGMTGHYEAVQISYDPERITYEELLDVYWRQIDPTDEGGQFVDQGSQYRTAIFYHNQAQKEQAENFRKMLLSMARDMRVILIKLADRVHNMRTLGAKSEKRAHRIARETKEIYAPLAHRLGIAKLKWELEDLSFKVLHPDIYEDIKQKVSDPAKAVND